MYELSRVLLRGVGPEGARYEDVLLDLSSVGLPFGGRQMGLFEQETPRRPSPATVLFLENGGGKSVLLKLIFSVMLPGRRNAMGGAGSGGLERLVLPQDTSHTVLEWTHARSGRKLITGKVSEWRDQRASSDHQNLIETWYHLRPSADLDLLGLPFSDGHRYLRLTAYLEELAKAHTTDRSLEFAAFDRHGQWVRRLTDLEIDPELFRYQLSMNADEGEAAEAFSFTNDKTFVDFLLRAVLDPEPPKELARLLDTYAERLTQRGLLEHDRAFVEGALEILGPLAEAADATHTARTGLSGIERTARAFLGELAARASAEKRAADQFHEEREKLTADLDRHTAERDRLAVVTTEIERLTALLRLEEAIIGHSEADEAAEKARTTAQAWAVTPLMLRHLTRTAQLGEVRNLVDATEEKARPAREIRDTSVARLHQALGREISRMNRTAKEREAEAGAEAERATQAQKSHNEAIGRAIGREKDAEVAEERVTDVRAQIARAVAENLLPPDTSVADAAERARTTAAENAAEAERLQAESERLERELSSAQEQLHGSERRRDDMRRRYETAEESWRRAKERKEKLATDPGLIELLAGEPGDIEETYDTLVRRLREIRDQTLAKITDRRVAEAGDERARLALETNELLPPSPEAVQARDALVEADITAWTGWEYLAATPDRNRRRRLWERVPHLAGGVLINDPEKLDEARGVLNDKDIHPAFFLAVGTTEGMEGEHPPLVGVDFVVPAHPALYDEQAADAERATLLRRHEQRVQELAELTSRQNRAAEFLTALRTWRADHPAGRTQELRARSDELRGLLAEADAEVEEVRSTRETLTEVRKAVASRITPLRKAQRELDQRTIRLKALAEQETKVGGWLAEATLHREAAAAERTAAKEAAREAESRRTGEAAAQREADVLSSSASRLADERAHLPAVPDDPAVPAFSKDEPPLEVLRRLHTEAVERYRRVSVGDRLLADLRAAEDAVTETEQELNEHPEPIRTRATELLKSPEGADSASREPARAKAERDASVVAARAAELGARVAQRREEYERYREPDGPVNLTPFEAPSHLAQGLRTIDEAKRAGEDVQRIVENLKQHGLRVGKAWDEADRAHEAFGRLAEPWHGLGGDEAPLDASSPFGGELPTARDHCDSLRKAWETAREVRSTAEKNERDLCDRLAAHAGAPRFSLLNTANRQIIQGTPRDELPGHAEEWRRALSARLQSLKDDLESIERHRQEITGLLAQQVDDALNTLRRAQRLSRLPKGLADWAGQEFLRISFATISDEALQHQMSLVIDEAAEQEAKRDGLSLILRGVSRAAEPKGFTVKILKPDRVLRTERVPVGDIKTVFSGGQILTTAIILYCTMAALRANDRGRTSNQHSGVLFLDNPIGRASAGYLLRLQQSVARALGVQLIFTTGLFDTTALDTFPLVIRLRNDADLRARRKYLSVDSAIGRLVQSDLGPSAQPQLSAMRYFTHEQDST
ncbi:hypothetical protein GCM10010232_15850 [Streptomyces amakusaensis]|uniref:Chromosome segregation ATPase n=1 Tax=Streptomyces amakusaensis TaxID=67271 RepID=A0ABW0AH57_9ACTN